VGEDFRLVASAARGHANLGEALKYVRPFTPSVPGLHITGKKFVFAAVFAALRPVLRGEHCAPPPTRAHAVPVEFTWRTKTELSDSPPTRRRYIVETSIARILMIDPLCGTPYTPRTGARTRNGVQVAPESPESRHSHRDNRSGTHEKLTHLQETAEWDKILAKGGDRAMSSRNRQIAPPPSPKPPS
jgi:hypothetical protein